MGKRYTLSLGQPGFTRSLGLLVAERPVLNLDRAAKPVAEPEAEAHARWGGDPRISFSEPEGQEDFGLKITSGAGDEDEDQARSGGAIDFSRVAWELEDVRIVGNNPDCYVDTKRISSITFRPAAALRRPAGETWKFTIAPFDF